MSSDVLVGTAAIGPEPGHVRVVVTLCPGYSACSVEVAGDFSAWAPIAMVPDAAGRFSLELVLRTGRRWRYRFLLDGERWINDPQAPDFVPGPNGSPASALST